MQLYEDDESVKRKTEIFVVGKKDGVINFETMYPQMALCKYPSVLMLENSGHMSFYEAPKETLKEFELFAIRTYRNKF